MSYLQLSQLCAGFVYIYPVLSRRSQGLSIGINLHPSHVCNWHCVYCQVPNLSRGKSPDIDLAQLLKELKQCIETALALNLSIADIAFAGDGEPTTSPQFLASMVNVIDTVKQQSALSAVKIRVISNGSQMHVPDVQQALRLLGEAVGEVWFKFDAGTAEEMQTINQVSVNIETHKAHLKQCAALCNTWVQTCVLALSTNQESVIYPALAPYLAFIQQVKSVIKGVLIYSVARPSQQSSQVKQVSEATLLTYEKALREAGLVVKSYL